MNRSRRIAIGVSAVVALAAGAAGIAQAVGGDDDERVTGPAAERAARAALEIAGGGRVTEVEREDEGGSGWEVEVRRADGSQVEVHLDDAFRRSGEDAPRPAGVKSGAGFTTRIDNPYWPMRPGSRWVYREIDAEGAVQRVVVTVTTRTKRIANGVTARVVHDRVTQRGEIVEDTDDWYAQDSAGNVWYLGEDTTEYEDGRPVTKAGSWEAGVDGAEAGIIMPARPRVGMRYRQEHYAGEAEDRAQVLSLREQAETAAGHWTRVLMTKDYTPLEPKVLEYKLYARGVGPVLILAPSGGGGREELVEFRP